MKKFPAYLYVLLLPIIVCLLAQMTLAQTQPSSNMVSANEFFQAKNWTEAAKAYEEVLKDEPNNGRAWFLLGVSRFSLQQYESAIRAWEKDISITDNPVAIYNVGCAYARMNQKDRAFEWLNRSVSKRLPPNVNLAEDEDLASLRNDLRFKELLASLDKARRPCMYSSEARQFDFWVGEWDVFDREGQSAGTNIIQQFANGCGILENWSAGGKSINFYDKNDGKWYQYWVGSTGIVLRYSGIYKDGAMRYEGETTLKDGTKTFNRLTFFNVDPNTIRQLAEHSTDGVTWHVSYDLKYKRKK